MNAVARTLTAVAHGLAAATIGLPATAAAQQLWSVEEVAAQPVPRIVSDRVAASVAGAATTGTAAVQVEFDYLRLGMGYLELPLPDGSLVEAENAVFEDRGDGNLMWTGEVPGAGYESVLLTVQDGHPVGWFGEPGGPKYVVYAGPNGSGSLAVETGPTGDWCGVGAGPDRDLVRPAAASDRPASVTSQSTGGRLRILVLYPEGTEHHWRLIGGPAVGIQHLSDYLNLVFRNGAIAATANLIPVRWDPEANHPARQGLHFQDRRNTRGVWHWEFSSSAEVDRLRRRYRPDLVHFTPAVGTFLAAGEANRRRSFDLGVLFGWSLPTGNVFAHEIGHNLGGRHEPVTFGDRFAEVQSEALRPHVFGHTDLTSCAQREGYPDSWLVCPRTIMSYGQDLRDDPQRFSAREPFYSSVRHEPNGWTIGVAGTSEVERLFHETVPVAVRGGEASRAGEQYPRRVTGARWTGHDTVRLDWSEDWRSRSSGALVLVLSEGANDAYQWLWDREKDRNDPPLHERSDPNISPIVRADGSQVGVEVAGLRPGGAYRIQVRGPRLRLGGDLLEPLNSDVFRLRPPRRTAGSPMAPSNVAARVTGPNSVRLQWRSNVTPETGHEVWWRKWSGDEPDRVWRRYGQPLPARTRSVAVTGLMAEEAIQVRDGYWDTEKSVWVDGQNAKVGRYSFVVVAFNDAGWSASETFNLEFTPGSHPDRRRSDEIVDCSVWGRPTGTDLDGHRVHACLETPDGAPQRIWDYRLEADQSGLLYFSDRDDAEILVKMLDGCSVNGHRWVFLAPVTDLPFRLAIRESGPYVEDRRQDWYYDSERRPQEEIAYHSDGNLEGRTARTVIDTMAFPCTTAEVAAAKTDLAVPASVPLLSGAATGCEPSGPALTLLDGYRVSMCFETENGETGNAKDWELESSRMGLLYFLDPDLVDALIKVRDDCAVGGNVSVFVAPATTAAFNLRVESPNGYVWRHSNRLGETAEAVSDVSAFPCTGSPPEALVCTGVTCLLQGERFRVKAWYSKGGSRSRQAGAIAAALGASAGLFGGDGTDPELLVRIVNRCRASGWWEVHGGVASEVDFRFAIRDTKTNALKWFRSSGRSVVDTQAFACTESDFGAMAGGAPSDPGASCTGTTCLLRDRVFRVKSWYRLDGGSTSRAAAVSVDLGGSAGLYAFESGNPELLVRIADTCSMTGYWTVYAGAASDAVFSVAIRDTGTNELKWFRSSGGRAIADAAAFACR